MGLDHVEQGLPSPAPGWGFRALSLSAVLATFALITVGGVVRLTGSGLGCPDWPLCHGQVVPPTQSYHTIIEYSHRLLASLVSILVVSLAGVAWWRYRARRPIVVAATLALVTLGLQVILGGITVLTELPPAVVTLHLGVAQLLLALLVAALIWGWQGEPRSGGAEMAPERTSARRRMRRWIHAAAGGTFLLVLSGSYVVAANATASCPGWPLCDGGLLPANQPQWIHMAHRWLGALAGGLVVWGGLLSWRARRQRPEVGVLGAVTLALFVAQVMVGAANPWTGFVWPMRALHLSLATALWGSVVALLVLVYQARAGQHGALESGARSPGEARR